MQVRVPVSSPSPLNPPLLLLLRRRKKQACSVALASAGLGSCTLFLPAKLLFFFVFPFFSCVCPHHVFQETSLGTTVCLQSLPPLCSFLPFLASFFSLLAHSGRFDKHDDVDNPLDIWRLPTGCLFDAGGFPNFPSPPPGFPSQHTCPLPSRQ